MHTKSFRKVVPFNKFCFFYVESLKVFENLPDSSFLKPYLNKLKIQRIFDIHCMNIGGKDEEPDRTGVYHLSFPKEWKREHISELFVNCGKCQNEKKKNF